MQQIVENIKARGDDVLGRGRMLPMTTPPPDQFVALVGPPAVAHRSRSCRHLLGYRGKRNDQNRDHHERESPDRKRPAPGPVCEREDERDRQYNHQNFADEPRYRSSPDPEPSAYERRERRLHDGDACAHHDGSGVEGKHIKHCAAQTRGDARNQQPGDQRWHGAEARDQQ
jgi:hypothetical protein